MSWGRSAVMGEEQRPLINNELHRNETELQDRRKTWYFIAPESKLADVYNMLHLPYTAMALSLVLSGAALAPQVHTDRVIGALLAYFFGLGIGAHALDQLEPGGSHYVEKLSRSELAALSVLGLAAGVTIGLYFALTVTKWLIPLIAAGAFFAVAYPLPSRVAGGLFHNDLTFSVAWGFLPFLTSYLVNTVELAVAPVAAGFLAALAAWAEIRLSRRARALRKEGSPAATYEGLERELKMLVMTTCTVSLLLAVARLA